jgi:excisionase family DNA binding protein
MKEPQKPEPKALLTTEEFAHTLSVKPATVRKWRYQGRLEPVKLGRAVRFRRTDLHRVVADGLTQI